MLEVTFALGTLEQLKKKAIAIDHYGSWCFMSCIITKPLWAECAE